MPNNKVVIDVKPRNTLVIDSKSKNSGVIDVKSRNVRVFSETQLYEYNANVRAGQPMGLLLALTYPVTDLNL